MSWRVCATIFFVTSWFAAGAGQTAPLPVLLDRHVFMTPDGVVSQSEMELHLLVGRCLYPQNYEGLDFPLREQNWSLAQNLYERDAILAAGGRLLQLLELQHDSTGGAATEATLRVAACAAKIWPARLGWLRKDDRLRQATSFHLRLHLIQAQAPTQQRSAATDFQKLASYRFYWHDKAHTFVAVFPDALD